VDGNGNLHVPENYRRDYEYLGSWAVAADQGQGSKDLHVVYASPGAAEAYKAAGRFPEGTVLLKEVFQAATMSMTTGTVSRADLLKGWFVMVRDTSGRHAGSKLWGDGWGWSWFDAGNPTRTTSTDYKANCRGCREPIVRGSWRIRLVFFEEGRFHPAGFVHLACGGAYFECGELVERLLHFSPALEEDEREALRVACAA